MTPHLIATQEIELDLPSKEVALHIQDRVSFLYSYRWKDIIEQCLNEAIGEDQLIQLESVELDLGEMSLEEWEEEMPQRLKQALRKYLKELIPEWQQSISPKEGRLFRRHVSYQDLLKQALKAGYLTAWQQWPSGEDFGSLWQRVMENESQSMVRFFQQSNHKRQMALRLSRQLSEPSLFAFLDALSPHSSRNIQQYIHSLQQHPFFVRLGNMFHSLMWASLLEFIGDRRSGTFHSDLFLQHLLHRLAEFQQTSLSKVIHSLEETLDTNHGKKTQWGKDLLSLLDAPVEGPTEHLPLIWIQQFLEQGYVPHQLQLGIQEIRKIYQNLLRTQPGELVYMLKKQSASASFMSRLLLLVQEQERISLLTILVPTYADFLMDLVQQFTSSLTEVSSRIGYLPPSVFRDRIWEMLLHLILKSSQTTLSLSSLLSQILHQIENEFGLEGLLALDLYTRLAPSQQAAYIQKELENWEQELPIHAINSYGSILSQFADWFRTGILPQDAPQHPLYVRQLFVGIVRHYPKQLQRMLAKNTQTFVELKRLFSVLENSQRQTCVSLIFPGQSQEFDHILEVFSELEVFYPVFRTSRFEQALWVGVVAHGLKQYSLSPARILPALIWELSQQFDFLLSRSLLAPLLTKGGLPKIFHLLPSSYIRSLLSIESLANTPEFKQLLSTHTAVEHWDKILPFFPEEIQKDIQKVYLLKNSLDLTQTKTTMLVQDIQAWPLLLHVLREAKLPSEAQDLSPDDIKQLMAKMWKQKQPMIIRVLFDWPERIEWKKVQAFLPKDMTRQLASLEIDQPQDSDGSPDSFLASPFFLLLYAFKEGQLPLSVQQLPLKSIQQSMQILWQEERETIKTLIQDWSGKITWHKLRPFLPEEMLKEGQEIDTNQASHPSWQRTPFVPEPLASDSLFSAASVFLFVLKEARLPEFLHAWSQTQIRESMKTTWQQDRPFLREQLLNWHGSILWKRIQPFFPQQVLDDLRSLVDEQKKDLRFSFSLSNFFIFLTLIKEGRLPRSAQMQTHSQIQESMTQLWREEKAVFSFLLNRWEAAVPMDKIAPFFPSAIWQEISLHLPKAQPPRAEESQHSPLLMFLHLIQTASLPPSSQISPPYPAQQQFRNLWDRQSEDIKAIVFSWPKPIAWDTIRAFLPPHMFKELQALKQSEYLREREESEPPSSNLEEGPSDSSHLFRHLLDPESVYLHVWTFELKHGQTPWWNRLSQKESILTHMSELLRAYPDLLVPLFCQSSRDSHIRERILSLLRPTDCEFLLPLLTPDEPRLWLQWIDDLSFLQQQQGFSTLTVQELRKKLLYVHLKALLPSLPSYSPKEVMRMSLQSLPLKDSMTIDGVFRTLQSVQKGNPALYQHFVSEQDEGRDAWRLMETILREGSGGGPSASHIHGILQDILTQSPKELASYLRLHLQENTDNRWIDTLSTSLFEQLVRLLSPQHAASLLNQLKDFSAILSTVAFEHNSPLTIKQKLWRNTLIVASIRSQSSRPLLHRVLSDLAQAEGSSLEQLSGSLLQIQTMSGGSIHPGLELHLRSFAQPSGTQHISSPSSPTRPAVHYPGFAESTSPKEEIPPGEWVFVSNAGLVLLAPYLGMLFQRLGYTNKQGFEDPESQLRAPHLLQYLVNGQSNAMEFELSLNKILCGLQLNDPLPKGIELSTDEVNMSQSLLEAVCQAWPSMRSSSAAALQESFLQRAGQVRTSSRGWELQVEKAPFDMLMQTIPWSFATIKLSFMKLPLYVVWE
ncbi:MAG: contractile injection system tape measure protein [Bacteroidota bacterium]